MIIILALAQEGILIFPYEWAPIVDLEEEMEKLKTKEER